MFQLQISMDYKKNCGKQKFVLKIPWPTNFWGGLLFVFMLIILKCDGIIQYKKIVECFVYKILILHNPDVILSFIRAFTPGFCMHADMGSRDRHQLAEFSGIAIIMVAQI